MRVPVPHNDVRCDHCLLCRRSSQQFCLCVSPSLHTWALRVVRPVYNSPLKLISTHCLKVFFSACQRFTHKALGLATTQTGLPPIQVLLSQMPPDDFFAHNQRVANSLKHSISPFRGKFICFISRYSVIVRYSH
jgi:hypothetical protein